MDKSIQKLEGEVLVNSFSVDCYKYFSFKEKQVPSSMLMTFQSYRF